MPAAWKRDTHGTHSRVLFVRLSLSGTRDCSWFNSAERVFTGCFFFWVQPFGPVFIIFIDLFFQAFVSTYTTSSPFLDSREGARNSRNWSERAEGGRGERKGLSPSLFSFFFSSLQSRRAVDCSHSRLLRALSTIQDGTASSLVDTPHYNPRSWNTLSKPVYLIKTSSF